MYMHACIRTYVRTYIHTYKYIYIYMFLPTKPPQIPRFWRASMLLPPQAHRFPRALRAPRAPCNKDLGV